MPVGRNWNNSANLHNKVSRKAAAEKIRTGEMTTGKG